MLLMVVSLDLVMPNEVVLQAKLPEFNRPK